MITPDKIAIQTQDVGLYSELCEASRTGVVLDLFGKKWHSMCGKADICSFGRSPFAGPKWPYMVELVEFIEQGQRGR